jgi:protein TonB
VESAKRMDMNRHPDGTHPRMEGGGREAAGGLLASLCLHILVAVAMLGAANAERMDRTPPVIDLALVPAGRTAMAVADRRQAFPPPSPLPSNPVSGPRRGPPASERPRETVPHPVAGSPVKTALPEAAAALKAVDAPPAGPETESSRIPAEAPPPMPGGTGPANAHPGGGFPAGEESAALLRAEGPGGLSGGTYGSIRSFIQQGVAYPALARKMGWEGRVVVSFRILPDGSVRDIRVVEGSGHAILDRNAVEAVRSASPFPRPPAAADILTPVVYKLN